MLGFSASTSCQYAHLVVGGARVGEEAVDGLGAFVGRGIGGRTR
jgi:hypothetical protein